MLFRIVSGCLLAGFGYAQQAPPAACTIDGAVTDASTGLPVVGATLILNSGKLTSVIDSATDGGGRFSLHLTQSMYSVVASAKGYGRQTLIATCGAAPQRALAFTLSPEATVTGRVTDADGAAAAGARITLLRTTYTAGEKRLAVQGGAVAGEDGQFSLDNLPAGLYFVLAMPPAKTKKTDDQVYVATFYPSAIDAAAAAPIHIRGPGEVGGMDIRLQKARAFAVRGVLLAGDVAGGVRDFTVTLRPQDRRLFGPSVSIQDDKGHFEFAGVVPGSYTLLARRVGAITPSARLRIDVGDADLNDVELPLNVGVTASGAIAYEDKSQTAAPSGQIFLQPWDESASAFQMTPAAGKFRVDAIPLGTYRVIPARLPRQAYAKSLRIDGQDVPDWIADFSAPVPHTVEIVVGSDAGSVSGTVRDSSGNPAPKAFVTLVPAGAVPLTGPQYASVTSDDKGRYTFSGVQPGQYKVYAWEKVTPGVVQNRDVLSQFSTQSTDAEVTPSGMTNADASLIAASATAAIE